MDLGHPVLRSAWMVAQALRASACYLVLEPSLSEARPDLTFCWFSDAVPFAFCCCNRSLSDYGDSNIILYFAVCSRSMVCRLVLARYSSCTCGDLKQVSRMVSCALVFPECDSA